MCKSLKKLSKYGSLNVHPASRATEASLAAMCTLIQGNTMSRTPVSFEIADLSQFAKNLSRQWPVEKPSHLTLLNLLSKAAGFQNYQHLLSKQTVAEHPSEKLDKKTTRWLRLFNDIGQPVRWPTKHLDQRAILWVVGAQLPEFKKWSEKQINAFIKARIAFADYAIVRRELISMELLGRTADGSNYWSESFQYPDEFKELLGQVHSRLKP